MNLLLDTNVVSELRKAKSGKINPNVQNWAANVIPAQLFLSVVTLLELEMGIGLIERRDTTQAELLRAWFHNQVLSAFNGRILAIDTDIALCCGRLHVPDPRSERDALIAATALVHNMTVVIRNAADFKATGVNIINPWQ